MEVESSGDTASNRPGSIPMLPESLDTLSSFPLEDLEAPKLPMDLGEPKVPNVVISLICEGCLTENDIQLHWK